MSGSPRHREVVCCDPTPPLYNCNPPPLPPGEHSGVELLWMQRPSTNSSRQVWLLHQAAKCWCGALLVRAHLQGCQPCCDYSYRQQQLLREMPDDLDRAEGLLRWPVTVMRQQRQHCWHRRPHGRQHLAPSAADSRPQMRPNCIQGTPA